MSLMLEGDLFSDHAVRGVAQPEVLCDRRLVGIHDDIVPLFRGIG